MSARRLIPALLIAAIVGLGAHHAFAGFGPSQGAASGAIEGTASQWSVDASGDLVPATNNADDVGDASAAPRTVRAATSVLTPGLDALAAGALTIGGTTATSVVVRGAATFDTNGRLTLPNGTSGTPSIVGSDADSGLYLNGASTEIRANNAAVMAFAQTVLTAGTRLYLAGNQLDAFRLAVTASTGDATLTTLSYGTAYTNAGAAGEVILTLPTAAAGGNTTFVVDAAQFLRVKAATGDVIRGVRNANVVAGTVESSASAGYWRSNVPGAWLKLVAIDATTWQVVSIGGTWTIDS